MDWSSMDLSDWDLMALPEWQTLELGDSFMSSFSGGPKTGHKSKLYVNTGTFGTPVWTLVGEIGDVSLPDFSRGVAELKRRAKGFSKGLAHLHGLPALEFKLIHGLDASTFNLICGAFLGASPYEWLIANGLVATSGTEGFRMPAVVEQFPWDQPLEDVSGHDIRLVLSLGGTKEVQQLSFPVGGVSGGNFNITYEGTNTANIPYNASITTIQNALNAIPAIGAGGVAVSGGPLPGSSVTITFTKPANVTQLIGVNTNLTGTNTTISLVTNTAGNADETEPAWMVVP